MRHSLARPTSGRKPITAMLRLSAAGALWLRAAPALGQGVIDNPLGRGATFRTIIERIADFALTVVGPLSVIMVLIAGVMYMTAGGSEDRVKRANKTLLFAVIGIAVVLLAKAVELIVRDLLGGR